ncbi:MAG: hypothetical protein LT102_14885 [Burkholderiaceae bacterium]|nr:hypothetical protein [Burkholderiaceae bacterium]
MTEQTGLSGRAQLLTAGIALALSMAAPYASATTVRIDFGGAAGNGYAELMLAPDPDASANYKPDFNTTGALSPWDPEGAQHITGAVGSFDGVAITGIMDTTPGAPPEITPGSWENLPKSFSWLSVGTGQKSYDNLFYADGSPLVCPPLGDPPYTFHGGFLDIFGVLFTLENGDLVHLWSDGVTTKGAFGPDWPGGLTFGLNVYTRTDGGGYEEESAQFAGAFAAVPEPDILWLFGAALLGLLASGGIAHARGRAESHPARVNRSCNSANPERCARLS